MKPGDFDKLQRLQAELGKAKAEYVLAENEEALARRRKAAAFARYHETVQEIRELTIGPHDGLIPRAPEAADA